MALLSLKEIQADIPKASVEYFHLNAGLVTSPVTLWEAYKAVLRGHIIQLAAKRKQERCLDLEVHLEVLSTAFKQYSTPANRKLLDQAVQIWIFVSVMELSASGVGPVRSGTLRRTGRIRYPDIRYTPKFTPITLRT